MFDSVPPQAVSPWRTLLCQVRNLRDLYIECGFSVGDARRRAIVAIEQRASDFKPITEGRRDG
jgi:hypothetical protein